MEEIWKDIPNFEGYYQASTLGNIRSIKRTVKHKDGKVTVFKGRNIKPSPSHKGYLRVYLSKDCKKHTLSVHRLIALTFIPNIECKPQVNHKNTIKTDNSVGNLEWMTNKENCSHAAKNKLYKPRVGVKSPLSKLDRWEVLFIIDSCNSQFTSRELGDIFDLSPDEAGSICKGRSWMHMDNFRIENGIAIKRKEK